MWIAGIVSDQDKAIECWKSAAKSSSGPSRSRIQAAMLWAQFLQNISPSSPSILEAFEIAMNITALIAGRVDV